MTNLRDILIPNAGVAKAWDETGVSSKDAIKELIAWIEAEIIGEDELDAPEMTLSARVLYGRNELRAEQRAKLAKLKEGK
jgi:hypothetical protein